MTRTNLILRLRLVFAKCSYYTTYWLSIPDCSEKQKNISFIFIEIPESDNSDLQSEYCLPPSRWLFRWPPAISIHSRSISGIHICKNIDVLLLINSQMKSADCWVVQNKVVHFPMFSYQKGTYGISISPLSFDKLSRAAQRFSFSETPVKSCVFLSSQTGSSGEVSSFQSLK